MLPARSPTDPMFVNATLDLVEMVKAAKVNSVIFRIHLLESNLKLLRWPVSALLLVCRL